MLGRDGAETTVADPGINTEFFPTRMAFWRGEKEGKKDLGNVILGVTFGCYI